jgi:PHS family inorganic phosphate transporter-like MFS transporter
VGRIWGWVTVVGAILGVMAIIFRLTITDTGRYTLDVQDDADHAFLETRDNYAGYKSLNQSQSDIVMVERRTETVAGDDIKATNTLPSPFSIAYLKQYFNVGGNWRYLIGTSICWFLLDFGFNGPGINSPLTLAELWQSHPAKEAMQMVYG